MRWRWDQGRLDYLRFDNLKKCASVLVTLEGAQVNDGDPLRKPLMDNVGLPFAPDDYRVWRNYGRVLKCAMFATTIKNELVCTDLCRDVADASKAVTVDEYLSYVAPRFYYDSPAFQGYSSTGPQHFPFCSILKLLLARAALGQPAAVSIDEIFDLLIGNEVTGLESVEEFRQLASSGYVAKGDEPRQLRELVIFLSQFDFLKWQRPNLILDVDAEDADAVKQIEALSQPIVDKRQADSDQEILALGSSQPENFKPVEISSRTYNEDVVFTEGKKVRVTHLRTERSSKLREFYYSTIEKPYECDMCQVDVTNSYPWVDKLLEVHHLLPLSSPIRVENSGTSISDLVGLCPTCHRAVHAYYRTWLKEKGLDDFKSYEQAHDVYAEAKNALNS